MLTFKEHRHYSQGIASKVVNSVTILFTHLTNEKDYMTITKLTKY